jgi:hypothetical protein
MPWRGDARCTGGTDAAPTRKPRPAAVSFRHAAVSGRGFGAKPGDRGNKVSIGVMHPSLHTLYSYWNELRAGRIAPQRLEIEPSRIASILSETFMLEHTDAGTYQFRLAGTRLCEIFGTELRGKNFLDGWSEQDRNALERDLATIGEQGAAAVLSTEGIVDTRHRVEFAANLLPLLHAGKITRIIGVMSPTTAPHWLGSEPLRSRHLKHHRLIWPDGRPHAMLARMGRQTPFQPALAAPGVRLVKSEGRRFRVVDGGRSDKQDKYGKR